VLQSGATTKEIAELLQSRRYCLLARLCSERPGPELMQALREAPIDELEEHGECSFDQRNIHSSPAYRALICARLACTVADFDRRRAF
jgi:hypothetical protein